MRHFKHVIAHYRAVTPYLNNCHRVGFPGVGDYRQQMPASSGYKDVGLCHSAHINAIVKEVASRCVFNVLNRNPVFSRVALVQGESLGVFAGSGA